ncbi:MAG: hypothetical protein A2486_00830 [Burkholderiales bacterium RIFOXYC12_FULL_65_23]|uniref:ABC transporter substrate-binding protein n=1 Tax=Malikia spinosa TaxID=86180 RepID=UPI0008B86F39|nr:ABC transporter substrate binding protein [Malikia spinosa]OGB72319.1 MAG: hypothetical protein A2486_00830 [Burkholderiales bacterium RIFOXYC12_FULL_65_23]
MPGRLAQAAEAEVWVVLSENGGAYAEAVRALQEAWAREFRLALNWRVATWSELPLDLEPLPQLTVTLGARACLEAVELTLANPALARVPLLATLLPQASYPALAAKVLARNSSALFLDQPPERIARLLRLALPEHKRVGVLFGPDSLAVRPVLSRALAARGLTLVEQTILNGDKGVYPSLRALFDESDLLLVMPDKLVYSPQNMPNILLAAYRQRIPLVSYSAAHVRAGALLALHTAPADTATQIAQAVHQLLSSRKLPAPALADAYSVAVNDQVARSLGLSLPTPAALALALKSRGVNP